MQRELQRMEVLEVGCVRPRKVHADQRDVLERGEGVVEDDDGSTVGGEVEVLSCAIVLEMIELQSLQSRCRPTGGQRLACDKFAFIGANLQKIVERLGPSVVAECMLAKKAPNMFHMKKSGGQNIPSSGKHAIERHAV